jgi:hypothetical protein
MLNVPDLVKDVGLELDTDRGLGLEETSTDVALVFDDLETDAIDKDTGDIDSSLEDEESDVVPNNSDVMELGIDTEEFDTSSDLLKSSSSPKSGLLVKSVSEDTESYDVILIELSTVDEDIDLVSETEEVDAVLVFDGLDLETDGEELDIIVAGLSVLTSLLKSKSSSLKSSTSSLLKLVGDDKGLLGIEDTVLELVLGNGLSDILRTGVVEAFGRAEVSVSELGKYKNADESKSESFCLAEFFEELVFELELTFEEQAAAELLFLDLDFLPQ